MRELADAMPDAEGLLALEPEELASKLLFFVRNRARSHPNAIGGMFHPGNEQNDLERAGAYRDRWGEVTLALAEAWAWLDAQGLTVPAGPINGPNGWRWLSRRAKRFESEIDVRSYAYVRRLPKEALHPSIADKVWAAFTRGELDVAVFQAMKAVEVAVRDASGITTNEVGVKLMRRAFDPDPSRGPLTDSEADPGEREALSALFAGAIGCFKNPHSHRDVSLDDPSEAIEIIMLANRLIRIVEARKGAVQ
jgi:uncharacterized protein (TIGR02391 family)